MALACASGFAQVTITGVNSFNPAYSNPIMNKDNTVDGYYVFYLADKLKKGEREFAIRLFDKNLTEVATKKYVDNKNTFLMKSSFNNSAMMFAMANYGASAMSLSQADSLRVGDQAVMAWHQTHHLGSYGKVALDH